MLKPSRSANNRIGGLSGVAKRARSTYDYRKGTDLRLAWMCDMREPISRFPKRPTGPDQARRTLAECQAMLANPRLSPEMRRGLEEKVAALKVELQAEAARRARDAEATTEDRSPPRRSPRR